MHFRQCRKGALSGAPDCFNFRLGKHASKTCQTTLPLDTKDREQHNPVYSRRGATRASYR